MCTRILWNKSEPYVVARTMDWPDTTMPVITAMPRGITRDGALAGGEEIAANGARWTSKYGSVVTTVYGVETADGMNERGFGAHLLYLENADFGERDLRKPAVGAHLWTQYLLDQAATVADAAVLLRADHRTGRPLGETRRACLLGQRSLPGHRSGRYLAHRRRHEGHGRGRAALLISALNCGDVTPQRCKRYCNVAATTSLLMCATDHTRPIEWLVWQRENGTEELHNDCLRKAGYRRLGDVLRVPL